ncbi:MAG TPA: ABC transporter ATP-binding protein, partial [Azoarcus sp.]|nr:ABC transporter ATP-binding protein [Azoarcus sp.]
AERRPLTKERDQLERRLDSWQKEKTQIDERLADPALYADSDSAALQDLLKHQAELAANIEEAEMRWLEIEERLESIPVD